MQFPDYGILYIDDEEKSLKYFQAIFSDLAPIYIASGPEEGYRTFCENHSRIALVLSDKKMPNESGLDLLARIRSVDDRPLRFLVTAFSDLNVAVNALNDGLLYSYLSKPWDPEELEHRLGRALRHFSLERERETLIAEKSEMLGQLIMADKAASIGILSTGLNHHIRNALTVFRTFHDMLPLQLEEEYGAKPGDETFWGEFYGEVGGQIDRMTEMLSSLSDGADLSFVSETEEMRFEDLVRKAAEMIANSTESCAVNLRFHPDLPSIRGDVKRLSHMLRMLMQEARQGLSSEGGVIEIELAPRDDEKGIRLTILDNGELIPEDDLKHLFEPFYVRAQRPEDLGSNLIACYLTTFSHGGKIRAFRSRDNRNGFEVCLPLSPPSRELIENDQWGFPSGRFETSASRESPVLSA